MIEGLQGSQAISVGQVKNTTMVKYLQDNIYDQLGGSDTHMRESLEKNSNAINGKYAYLTAHEQKILQKYRENAKTNEELKTVDMLEKNILESKKFARDLMQQKIDASSKSSTVKMTLKFVQKMSGSLQQLLSTS